MQKYNFDTMTRHEIIDEFKAYLSKREAIEAEARKEHKELLGKHADELREKLEQVSKAGLSDINEISLNMICLLDELEQGTKGPHWATLFSHMAIFSYDLKKIEKLKKIKKLYKELRDEIDDYKIQYNLTNENAK